MITQENTLVFIDNDSKSSLASDPKVSYAFIIDPQRIKGSLALTFDTGEKSSMLSKVDGGIDALVDGMIKGMKECVHSEKFLSALQSSEDESDQRLAALILTQRTLDVFALDK